MRNGRLKAARDEERARAVQLLQRSKYGHAPSTTGNRFERPLQGRAMMRQQRAVETAAARVSASGAQQAAGIILHRPPIARFMSLRPPKSDAFAVPLGDALHFKACAAAPQIEIDDSKWLHEEGTHHRARRIV